MCVGGAYSRSQAKEKTKNAIKYSHSSHLKPHKTKKLSLSALPTWAARGGPPGSIRKNKHRSPTFPPALATPLFSVHLSRARAFLTTQAVNSVPLRRECLWEWDYSLLNGEKRPALPPSLTTPPLPPPLGLGSAKKHGQVSGFYFDL